MNKVMGIAILLLSYGLIAAGTQENDLLSLAKSGIEEQILISYIDAAKGPFNLTADQIIELKDLGVSAKVISEALRHGQNAEAAAAEPTTAANPEIAQPAVSNESYVEPATEAPVAPAYQTPAAPVAPVPPARDTVTVATSTVYSYPWCWSPYYDYYWPYADAYDEWLWAPSFGWGFGLGLGWGYGWRHRPIYGNHGFRRTEAGAYRTAGTYGRGGGARDWGGGGHAGGWGGGGSGSWSGGGRGGGWSGGGSGGWSGGGHGGGSGGGGHGGGWSGGGHGGGSGGGGHR